MSLLVAEAFKQLPDITAAALSHLVQVGRKSLQVRIEANLDDVGPLHAGAPHIGLHCHQVRQGPANLTQVPLATAFVVFLAEDVFDVL